MNKHYAVADLHGRLDLWNKIDEFTDDSDIIYVLGDCGDRGPEGWATIKAVSKSKKAIYLKGNHEKMLTNALFAFGNEDYSDAYMLTTTNGGQLTLEDALAEYNYLEWARFLKTLPTWAEYINTKNQHILLSHAGFIVKFNKKGELIIPPTDDLLWDREHLKKENYPFNSNYYSVFGHTPTPYLFKDGEWEPGAAYLSGNRIDIDNGSYATGISCLLDLDTFEEHIFQIK